MRYFITVLFIAFCLEFLYGCTAHVAPHMRPVFDPPGSWQHRESNLNKV